MSSMNHADLFMVALCLWREARGEGDTGMLAVACIIRNRVQKHHSTPYAEVVRKWQFCSITDPRDKQLAFYPAENDATWQQATLIASNVFEQDVADITSGCTLYYDDSIQFPAGWNKDHVQPMGKIGHFFIFKEI